MRTRNAIYSAIGFLVMFCLAAMLNTLALAGNANPPAGDPEEQLLHVCTYYDYDSIGTAVLPLGNQADIPIYVSSNGPITGFRMTLQLPLHVNQLAQIQVEGGTPGVRWPNTLQYGLGNDWWLEGTPGYYRLVIQDAVPAAEAFTPMLGEVFLKIHINTQCGNWDARTEQITWNLGTSTPLSYLTHDGCTAAKLSRAAAGGLQFNPISIAFDALENTGYIGDLDTVTVRCDNNYDFGEFKQWVYFEPNILTYAGGPEVVYTERSQGGTITIEDAGTWSGLKCLYIHGMKADGFGIWGVVPEELYRLVFRVTSLNESDTCDITFNRDGSKLPVIYPVGCTSPNLQLLPYTFVEKSYSPGMVIVPQDLVEFKVGEGAWSNQHPNCLFRVPVYVKNNYRITEFYVAVRNMNPALVLQGFEPESSYPVAADPWTCVGYKLVQLRTYMPTNIPRSVNNFQLIGYLTFETTTGVTNGQYDLTVLEQGCAGSSQTTCVYTADGVRTYPVTYPWGAPERVFDNGKITIGDPLVQINLPPAQSLVYPPKHIHEWWAGTPIQVKSNVNLTSLTFTITWPSSSVCGGVGGLAPGVTIDHPVNTPITDGHVTVTILNVMSSPDYRNYGGITFTNGEHMFDNWFNPGLINIGDLSSCGATPTPAATAGRIDLAGLPAGETSCVPGGGDPPTGSKEAALPDRFELFQNHPNPFNASTVVEFTLSEAAQTTLDVFNVMGQRVTTLLDAFTEAGQHSIIWNGHDAEGIPVASGMYFYRIVSGQHMETKKMVLMK